MAATYGQRIHPNDALGNGGLNNTIVTFHSAGRGLPHGRGVVGSHGIAGRERRVA